MALYDWFLSRDGIPEKTTFLKEQNQPTSKQNQEACIRIQINSCMLVFKRNLSHFFYILCRPIINGKMEEKTCGEGPSLISMFDDDTHLQQIIKNIKKSLNEGFREAEKYAATFQMYQAFYLENEAMDLQNLRETEHGNWTFAFQVLNSYLKWSLLFSPANCFLYVLQIIMVYIVKESFFAGVPRM